MKTLVRSALLVAATALMVLTSSTAGAQSGYEPVPPAPLPGPGTIVNTTGILSGEPGSALTDNAAAFQVPVVAAPAGTGGAGGGDLAFTGVDSNVLVAGGMTLVLLGGAAVIYSRKQD